MITRREFSRAALAAGSAMLLGAAGRARPNIIYILLDDAGWGDLSCYGQEKFSTPNIDRIANEGIKFTDHYAGSAVCAPSRCSLMTGMHTGHAAIRGNREVKPEGQAPLPEGAVTIPKLLKQAGYRTGVFGKWGLGAPGSTGDPMVQGFDEFFGYNCQRQAHNYYPEHLWHNDIKVPLDGKTYSHDLIVEMAMDFIDESKSSPFFLYLPVTIPHASLHAPEESVRPFRKKFWKYELTPGFYKGRPIRNPAACFAGMMTRLDQQIGDMLWRLHALGIDDNTIVMLSSDNGPHREGGAMPNFFNSSGPFRGYKRDLYEGGVRVPMIARWPGAIGPGSVTDHASAFWDVMPTVCELAGAPAPDGVDGISFAPTLLGRAGDQREHRRLYWEFNKRGGAQAARAGRWKAVINGVSIDPNPSLELYDLEADPGETNNLADELPEVAERMERIIQDAHQPSEEFKLLPGE